MQNGTAIHSKSFNDIIYHRKLYLGKRRLIVT